MVTVHFICGSIGAGKTAYAIALARRIGAVRFSTEEWMSRLPVPEGTDPSVPISWSAEVVERCELEMWASVEKLIERGINVVFDLAPSSREHRDEMRGLVAQTRAVSKLHYLDVGRDTRHARILERNRERSTATLEVSEEMFDWIDRQFEPPTDDELYGAMIVCED
ncbi:MAG TPA: ATP-binding protein [Polyangiaceae bacterium]|nr:ATP-binding protein [Polyangiaceae bacterium]